MENKESKFDIQDPRYKLDLKSDKELIDIANNLIMNRNLHNGSQFGPSIRMQSDEILDYIINERGLSVNNTQKVETTSFEQDKQRCYSMYSMYQVDYPKCDIKKINIFKRILDYVRYSIIEIIHKILGVPLDCDD